MRREIHSGMGSSIVLTVYSITVNFFLKPLCLRPGLEQIPEQHSVGSRLLQRPMDSFTTNEAGGCWSTCSLSSDSRDCPATQENGTEVQTALT